MITIGFPVYNVERYVSRSLESALNQDMDDIEIIVVDDCGNDDSMNIINKIIESHPKGSKVRIIKHERNKGLAEARNTVIRSAKGDYIYFMDSDDFIIPNTLSILYQSAEKYQADVVFSSTIKQEDDKTWTGDDDILPDRQFLEEGEFVTYVYMTPNVHVPITVWNILFRSSFIHNNNLLFPNIRYQEDIAFNELYHPLVKRAVVVGTKDPNQDRGELPVAFVEVNPETFEQEEQLKEELYNICLENVVYYSVPIDYILIDKLPETGRGKIDYRELVREYNQMAPTRKLFKQQKLTV